MWALGLGNGCHVGGIKTIQTSLPTTCPVFIQSFLKPHTNACLEKLWKIKGAPVGTQKPKVVMGNQGGKPSIDSVY